MPEFSNSSLQLGDHWQRGEFIVFGAGDVELAFGFAEILVRAFFVFADQPGAVEGCGGGDAFGVAGGGGERVGAAHAVAVGADGAFFRRRLCIDECQDVGEILHDRRDGHLGADRAHSGLLGAALGGDVGAVFRVFAGSIVQVGQHDIVADGAEAAGHVVEFLADAWGVHQHDHHGVWAIAFGMDDEGLHRAGPGLEIAGCFDHGFSSVVGVMVPRPRGWDKRPVCCRIFIGANLRRRSFRSAVGGKSMKLTDGQIAEYEERGFLVFPNLVDPHEIEILRADLGRVAGLEAEEVTREKSGVVRTVFRVHDPKSPTASAPFEALARLPRILGPAPTVAAG